MYLRSGTRDGRKVDSSRRRARLVTLAACSLSPLAELLLSVALVAALAGAAVLILPKGTSLPDLGPLPTPPPHPPSTTPDLTARHTPAIPGHLPGFSVSPVAVEFDHAAGDAGGQVGAEAGYAGGAASAEGAGVGLMGGGGAVGRSVEHAAHVEGTAGAGSFWGKLVRQIGTHGRSHEVHAADRTSPLDCLRHSTFVVNGTKADCGALQETVGAAAAAFAPATAGQHGAQRGGGELDSLTIETPACGTQGRGAEAAASPREYRMHVRRGGPDLAEVQQAFCTDTLDVLRPLGPLVAAPPGGPAPSVLIAGARSGAVPLLLAHLLHFHMRLTALEADRELFALAESNLRALADAGAVSCTHALLTATGVADVELPPAAGAGGSGGDMGDAAQAVRLSELQEQQEGGRFDLVVLRAAGTQPGVLEDAAARSVLCEATCVVVEASRAAGEASALAGQTQRLLDACSASHGMAEVSRGGGFAVACRRGIVT